MQQVTYREDYSKRPESGHRAYQALLVAGKMNPSSPLGQVWPSNSSCPIGFLFHGRGSYHPLPTEGREYFEVLYLCSGSAICNVQGRTFPFEEGDLVVIKSTLQNTIEWRTSPPRRLVVLVFDPDLIRCDGVGDGTEYLAPFLLQGSDFPHVVPARTGVPREVLEFMLRIKSELPASSPMARLAVRTYLKTLLMLLVNHYARHTGTAQIYEHQQRTVERLRPVFEYIGENCGSAIQVGDAARMCGMSETHFMSSFKHITGVSLMKYLKQYRIQRAQDLLVKTDRSIADISLDTGYCDQSYFGAVFRKLAGTTPAAYRRRYRKQRRPEEQETIQPGILPTQSSHPSQRCLSTVMLTVAAHFSGGSQSGLPWATRFAIENKHEVTPSEAEAVARASAAASARKA